MRVLTRDASKAEFPAGVEVAQGDLLDLGAVRAALTGVRTIFLLNAVTGDEFTQAIITLNLAREAGIELRIAAVEARIGDPYVTGYARVGLAVAGIVGPSLRRPGRRVRRGQYVCARRRRL